MIKNKIERYYLKSKGKEKWFVNCHIAKQIPYMHKFCCRATGGGTWNCCEKLSRNSLQGLDEFKNIVIWIAKLQHQNLMKLLGCCIQRE